MLLHYILAICIANLHIKVFSEKTTVVFHLNKNIKGIISECYEETSAKEKSDQVVKIDENGDVHVTASSNLNPMKRLDLIIQNFLYGPKKEGDRDTDSNTYKDEINLEGNRSFSHFPSGSVNHAEIFLSKSAVHLPSPDLLHTDHCLLRVTEDHMQTAVDAFAIILQGSLRDVLALPPDYVLRSARTITMMKIPQEKFAAMWDVVLNGRNPSTITYETLEMYRPLFKYLNGKQIARLNLTNFRIVNYIGTHPELNRLQVGVVANKYIQTNPNWRQQKYLNNMNNLLCGVPMSFMRAIDIAAYLKLEHQTFFHVKACDPLQKRFYLNMMTKTQALGKSVSWSARDVSRLGLLLSEVEGPTLAMINPEAMAGITYRVMAEIKPENMKYITEAQMDYIKPRAKNILAQKLMLYQDQADMLDTACRTAVRWAVLSLMLLAFHCLQI